VARSVVERPVFLPVLRVSPPRIIPPLRHGAVCLSEGRAGEPCSDLSGIEDYSTDMFIHVFSPLSLDRGKNLVMILTRGLTGRLTEFYYDLDLCSSQRVIQVL